MKIHRVLASVSICVLLLALAMVVQADDPPKSASDLPATPTPTRPPKGSIEPVPIHPVHDVLNPATAHITKLRLAKDGTSLVPVKPTPVTPPPTKGGRTPIRPVPGRIMQPGEQTITNTQKLLQSGPRLQSGGPTILIEDGFEGGTDPGWDFDETVTGGWDAVNCNGMAGFWSAWPAAFGTSLDPCIGGTGNYYPNNLDSWMMFGPFSLADAHSASLDFYYRIVSESCCDPLKWEASTDGTNYYGYEIAGSYTGGPFNSDYDPNYNDYNYNFASLDLTDVPVLGDVTGQPQVWIALHFVSDVSITYEGPFIDEVSLRKNEDTAVHVTNENFDVRDFPNQDWESFDNDGATNGDYSWDDVPCFSLSDGWSMWPANQGANALNPCLPTLANYPDYAQSWLVHGPFSLAGASEAWVDFYFRNQSEYGWDYFWWGASADGNWYYGYSNSGTYISGPYGDSYNRVRFDLSSVPTLGDLRGQPNVWLGFYFESDESNTDQGPFVDDVSVVVVGPKNVHLPVVLRAPPPPQTNLYVKNSTTGIASYTVVGTPQGNITCSNIPAGATAFCGTFTAGTYPASVSTAQCGGRTGEVNFAPGNVTRTVQCTHE